MFLVEQTTVPGASFPVSELKDHLLLGTGFADDAAQERVLEHYLRAATAAIEARTGKVILSKQYTWTLTSWRDARRQPLPLAPVISIDAVRLIDVTGSSTVWPPSSYRLEPDHHRPAIYPIAGCLPSVAIGGSVEIDFAAGFGPSWSDVPPSLQQAVILLAAHFYENRGATGSAGELPFGVSGLIERFRNIRILGGRER